MNRGEIWWMGHPHSAVANAVLVTRITRLGPAKLAELCRALDIATDC